MPMFAIKNKESNPISSKPRGVNKKNTVANDR